MITFGVRFIDNATGKALRSHVTADSEAQARAEFLKRHKPFGVTIRFVFAI